MTTGISTRHRVRVNRVQVGDILLDRQHDRAEPWKTVTQIDIEGSLVYAWLSGWAFRMLIGITGMDRTWVERGDV